MSISTRPEPRHIETPAISDQRGAADELVILLAAEPGAWAKLRDDHQDDGRGHCRVCAVGCRQGYQIWPCTIAVAVQRAAPVPAFGATR